ncbi:MAG: peptidoglycan D,D-transpeptidase FtsI family protein [Planctomycetota bacterium]
MTVKNHNFFSAYQAIVIVTFVTLIGVYIYKMFSYKNIYIEKKRMQYIKKIVVSAPLKNIYDRNGEVLALSVPSYSYFLDTTLVKNENELQEIARRFKYPVQKLIRKHRERKKFVWLVRKVSREIKHKFTGVFEVVEFLRIYPYRKLLSHIVGVRNKENEALGGLELSLDSKLYGGKKVIKYMRGSDGKQFLIEDFSLPVYSNGGIMTTIDIKLQRSLYEIATEAYQRWKPESLTAIAVEPEWGDIVAWVQIPTFDPLKYNREPIKLMKNLALTSPVEPGSLFKPFFYYMLLKNNVIDEDRQVFCEKGHFKIRSRNIYDHTPRGFLSAKEVIAYSSNIGITKLTQKLSQKDYIETLKTFRMLDRFSIGFVNTLKTKITPINKWSYHTYISLPMGYEILTTPFHLIRGYSAFANGGYLVNLSILRDREKIKRKVLDSDVVSKVQNALRLVTKIGTGKRADSRLYILSGKTGTSKLLTQDKKYTSGKHRSFFIGFGPASLPRLVVYFQLDQPDGAYFGGTVAAPYVKEFIEKSLQKLFVEFENSEVRNPLTQVKRE